MATYIAPIGHGLGDLIVSLPAVQSLLATGIPTYLVLRSPEQEGCQDLVPGLAGFVREAEFNKTEKHPEDKYINLRDHPMQTEMLWGSAEFDAKYPGYNIENIVRDISVDFGLVADFENLKPLPFEIDERCAGKVIFIPGTAGTFKCWTRDRWIDLGARIKAMGYDIAVVGQPARCESVAELIEAGLPWHETPDLKSALNAISSSHAVVSVDTGLMHLSLNQLIPTAAMWINNPGSLNYVRRAAHCFPVVSKRCHSGCVYEELHRPWNLIKEWASWHRNAPWTCHAEPADRCMNNVSVDTVFEQALKALEFKKSATELV